jgi:integrase
LVRRAYKPIAAICKEAGITQRFTPHGCRRTGADLYRRSGGERIAMAVAGHTTVEMHRRYTRVDATEQMQAAERAFGGLRLVRTETGDRTGDAGDQDVVTGGGESANVAS